MNRYSSSTDRFIVLMRLAGFITLSMAVSVANSQTLDIPDMEGAEISTSVEALPEGGLRSLWTIDNTAGSQAVSAIELPLGLDGGSATSIEGLDNSGDIVTSNMQRRQAGDLVGVAFSAAPQGWEPILKPSPFQSARWGAFSTPSFVSPGSSLTGIVLDTRSLPGIRALRVIGYNFDFRSRGLSE